MIPDVPLIKGEVDLLFAVLPAFYCITDGADAVDKIVHVHGAGKKARGISRGVCVITVEGDIVDIFIALVEHGQLPVSEGRHLGAG